MCIEGERHENRFIPEQIMLARLAQSDEMREFFIQMWIQNPALAKQGGARVKNLLTQMEVIATNDDSQTSCVGRALARHVGLKPDLQGVAHKCRQERCSALARG